MVAQDFFSFQEEYLRPFRATTKHEYSRHFQMFILNSHTK